MTLARNLLQGRREAAAPAARPEIDVGVRTVTVGCVLQGDLGGPNVLGWRREAVALVPNDRLAEEAAIAWFAETDQSSDCQVVFRIEDGRGNVEQVLVDVGPQVVARARSRTIVRGVAP